MIYISKKRYIDTKFWDDNYIIDKDPIEKLLFLYLLTNTLTNIIGIYEISLKRIAFDTGIDNEMVDKILKRFEVDDKIKYENGWVALKNFTEHQLNNPKINTGIERLIKEVPDNLVKWVNIDYDRLSIDYELLHPNLNTNLNTNSNDVVCVSPVETVETVDNSSKEKEKLLKKEMLDLVSGCFKESFLDGLFKKYPVEKIEKYFEELKYLENIRNPVGWLVTALKNDLDKGG